MHIQIDPSESFFDETIDPIRVLHLVVAKAFGSIGSPVFAIIDDVHHAHTTFQNLVDFPATFDALADCPGRCHQSLLRTGNIETLSHEWTTQSLAVGAV